MYIYMCVCVCVYINTCVNIIIIRVYTEIYGFDLIPRHGCGGGSEGDGVAIEIPPLRVTSLPTKPAITLLKVLKMLKTINVP
jgi:hypothetical protein